MNFGTLEEYLQTNNQNLIWNVLEDLVLKQELGEETEEFQYLLTVKS